jgi:hypothetical protein
MNKAPKDASLSQEETIFCNMIFLLLAKNVGTYISAHSSEEAKAEPI